MRAVDPGTSTAVSNPQSRIPAAYSRLFLNFSSFFNARSRLSGER